MSTRLRVLIPAALIAVVAGIAVAIAGNLSSAVSLSSYRLESGAPAEVSMSTPFGPSVTGELHDLELDLPRGFAFDPRAAATCTLHRARSDSCPRNSRIGSGTGRIRVAGQFLPQTDYDVKAAVYLTAARHRSDAAGVLLDVDEPQSQLSISLLGEVTRLRAGPFSLRIHFSSHPGAHPAGYELTLSRLALDLSAQRHAHSGARYSLLTNPHSCSRSGWPLLLSVSSASRIHTFRVSSPCHGHG